MPTFGVETIVLDLPPLVGAFSRRLHDAGVPVSAERASRFAEALTLVGRADSFPRRRLYWTARAVFVSDPTQVRTFDAVFAEVFGSSLARGEPPAADGRTVPAPPDERRGSEPAASPGGGESPDDRAAAAPAPARAPARRQDGDPARDVRVPVLASDEELIREKRFDALDADELAVLYRLMAKLALATPQRRTRRAEHHRHGASIDMRRTLRSSLRTGGDPIRLARRRRRVVRRRLVLLCDISGSMEPYARAYLQFLACAAGTSPGRNEAFAFATRLTRLTRALHSRHPERAIAQAAATAQDWSSGTRIGDALKTFNDRHGRRGMARGAVVVILSDGWERGDPSLVGREMERLARLAYRIVWVNPRVAASGFSPQAGGMAAALPYCDALVSGHSLAALAGVAEAIAAERGEDPGPDAGRRRQAAAASQPGADEPEPWASATGWAGSLPGSSVAMPSGYGPSRGRTTPGWGSS